MDMNTPRTKKSARHIFDNFYDMASESREELQIWGYTDRLSYEPGDTVALHVSTSVDHFELQITYDGLKPKVVHEESDLLGELHSTPTDCSKQGCQWPVAYHFEIPFDWRSGVYLIVLRATAKGQQVEYEHMIVLRAPVRHEKRDVVLVCATGTWVAYNDWGGANSYKGFEGPEGNGFSPRLSLQRPWARGFCKLPPGAPRTVPERNPPPGVPARYSHKEWAYANGYSVKFASAGWASYERHFFVWAERAGYQIDVLSLHDLHQQPELLEGYRCAVFVGHDEYWSWEMRDAVDSYVHGGGNVARFAGNFLWQIRLEDELRTQICYKYIARESDPLMATDSERRVTHTWEAPEVNRPGSLTFGVNATRGIYAHVGNCTPRGPGGFIVYRPEHWAFQNSYVSYGDVLGAESRIFGYEVDGLDYTIVDGLPYPVPDEDVPEGLEVLAMGLATNTEADFGRWGESLFIGDEDCAFIATALYGEDTPENRDKVNRGNGMVVSFQRGAGQVFTAATCEWVMGLTRSDSQVEQVTRNVLNRFTAQ